MALGEYRPPNQIGKDEDKYWKFTKIQILYALVGGVVGLLVLSLLWMTGFILFRVIGILIFLFLLIAGVAIGGLVIPDSKYLSGGGLRVDYYLIRKFKKKFLKRKKVVYTRNIDRDKLVLYRSRGSAYDGQKSTLMDDIRQMFGGE